MKKGFAVEGFIREDGTVRPLAGYDDTELRGKIAANEDAIESLDDRVRELEVHGAPTSDETKADKVEGATAGNLAGMDENGNLTDSGKAPSDFATADHTHSEYAAADHTHSNYAASDHTHTYITADGLNIAGALAVVSVSKGTGSSPLNPTGTPPRITFAVKEATAAAPINSAELKTSNFGNFTRALADPDSTPKANSNKLITSGAVKAALDAKNEISQYEGNSGNHAIVTARSNVDETMVVINVKENNSTSKTVAITYNNIENLERALDPDTEIEAGSLYPIVSGAVYTALAALTERVTVLEEIIASGGES